MSFRRSFVLVTAAMVLTSLLTASETERGEWTISPSSEKGKIHFSLESADQGTRHFHSSSDWNLSEFQGADAGRSTKHDVHFTVLRDAGLLECEGFLKDGSGAGLFTFTPSSQYATEMAKIGFGGVEQDKQLSFFLEDVGLAYAQQMKALNIEGLDTHKLIAFRIFRVDSQFIQDLRKEGLAQPPADKLIAFRIHGVTPEYIEKMRAHGMQNLTSEQLIRLRIFKIE